VQGRGGEDLTPEALQPNRVPGTLLRKEFQGDGPVKAELSRLVHHPHAAAAERSEDLVPADGGQGLRTRSGPPVRRVPGVARAAQCRRVKLSRQLHAVPGETPQVVFESKLGLTSPT